MKTVERKAANEEASDEQKVTLGSHRDIFLASRIYPQYNGTAPPKIHHSDQGVQYLSGVYVGKLNESRIRISLASRGAAWEIGYAERLIRTLKEGES